MTPTPANDNTAPERPAWFDALLLKYMPFIRKECSKRSTAAERDDFMQQSIARMLERWHQYRPGPDSGFAVWSKFVIRSVVRDAKRRPVAPVEFCGDVPEAVSPATQEDSVNLAQTVRWCDPRNMDALTLVAAGHTFSEAGATLGITKEGVRLRVNKGRSTMLRAANDNRRVRIGKRVGNA